MTVETDSPDLKRHTLDNLSIGKIAFISLFLVFVVLLAVFARLALVEAADAQEAFDTVPIPVLCAVGGIGIFTGVYALVRLGRIRKGRVLDVSAVTDARRAVDHTVLLAIATVTLGLTLRHFDTPMDVMVVTLAPIGLAAFLGGWFDDQVDNLVEQGKQAAGQREPPGSTSIDGGSTRSNAEDANGNDLAQAATECTAHDSGVASHQQLITDRHRHRRDETSRCPQTGPQSAAGVASSSQLPPPEQTQAVEGAARSVNQAKVDSAAGEAASVQLTAAAGAHSPAAGADWAGLIRRQLSMSPRSQPALHEPPTNAAAMQLGPRTSPALVAAFAIGVAVGHFTSWRRVHHLAP